jgi:hypothetical protein
MKTKLSYSIIKNLLNCFFLLENKKVNRNNLKSSFCPFQYNREIKQLIKILSVSQQNSLKNVLKVSTVVFYVEDLFTKNFLTLLITRCNLKIKVQVELLSLTYNPLLFSNSTVLNIYFVESKLLSSLQLRQRYLNVVFNSCGHTFQINSSGCYSVVLSAFDVKLFIFVVAVLSSFLTKNYEKNY